MATPPHQPADPSSAAHDRGPSSSELADRGDTRIAERVVEKVAAHAVGEVDRATGTARSVLGVSLGRSTEQSRPRVDATIDGQIAAVKVSMSVSYPAPIREVAAEVRRQVMSRVREITGLEVVEVDIEIPTLLAPAASRPARAQ